MKPSKAQTITEILGHRAILTPAPIALRGLNTLNTAGLPFGNVLKKRKKSLHNGVYWPILINENNLIPSYILPCPFLNDRNGGRFASKHLSLNLCFFPLTPRNKYLFDYGSWGIKSEDFPTYYHYLLR
jgi:hypothetical protein